MQTKLQFYACLRFYTTELFHLLKSKHISISHPHVTGYRTLTLAGVTSSFFSSFGSANFDGEQTTKRCVLVTVLQSSFVSGLSLIYLSTKWNDHFIFPSEMFYLN